MKINIQNKIKERGLNKNQFAKMTQLGYPAVCKLCNGETTRISFDTLEIICEVLECTPNDILVTDNPTVKRLMAYSNALCKYSKSKGDTD